MANTQQAKIITPKELEKLRRPLPRIWVVAAGILKGRKRIDALRYQRQIRKEWDRRLRKLARISH